MAMDEKLKARYNAALHAVQTAVALNLERGSAEGSPKHLRVGINSAFASHDALYRLLVAKGVITEEEYSEALVAAMEREVEMYRRSLGLPDNVQLR